MTLRRTFAHCLTRNLLAALALAVVVLFSLAGQDKVSVDRPDATGSAQSLVATYECSSAVQDPTHAVVTIDGVTRYVGKRITDKAIEQVAFGIDHGLTVHSFCP